MPDVIITPNERRPLPGRAAYGDLGLTAADTLELLARAPDPAAPGKLTAAQISAALKRAHRHDVSAKAAGIKAALRAPQWPSPPRSSPLTPPPCRPPQRS